MKCPKVNLLSSKCKFNFLKLFTKTKIKVFHNYFYHVSSSLISAAPVTLSVPPYEPQAIRLAHGGNTAPSREGVVLALFPQSSFMTSRHGLFWVHPRGFLALMSSFFPWKYGDSCRWVLRVTLSLICPPV